MNLEEFAKEQKSIQAEQTVQAEDGEFTDGDEIFDEQLLHDLRQGLSLIQSARTFFNFLADPTLCKAVSKRERDIMDKLSDKMLTYLTEMDTNYGEEAEEA